MRSALYEGVVRHRRFAPVPHELSYTMFMAYLDLSELGEVFRGRWLWSASAPALARFRRQDHLGDLGIPLDAAVRALVEERTGRRPDGPIRLLTHLAYYGWCFNPVSFYYCFDAADSRVDFVVAEVANTPWLERHCYVLDRRESLSLDSFRQRTKKVFHVSPFMDMDQEYAWFLREPGGSLSVHMENHAMGERLFDATMSLSRVEITGASLASALARWPFMTLSVVCGIHWEALKLWLKGAPVYDHPKKKKRVSA